MANSYRNDLTEGNIFLQLISFFGPMFFANLLQMVYNIVDMAIVGHFVGSNGLAAVSVSTSAISVLTFTAMGISAGGQVIVSQYTGAGRHDKTQKLIGTFFSATLVLSAILTLISVVFRGPILHFANVPESAWKDGVVYFVTCSCGSVFTYEYNAVSAIFRGMGDSRRPLVFVLIATILNVVLDILLVAVIPLGTLGAALATVISQAVCFSVSIIFMYRHKDVYGFDFRLKSFRIYRDSLLPLIKLGCPLALQGCLINIVILIVNRWINEYGVIVTAITGIGNRLCSVSQTFSTAIATSASSVVGQSVGAKKYDRVMKTVWASGALAFGIASCIALLMVIFPRAVYSIFTSDPEVLDMVKVYNPVAILLVYGSAFRAPANGLITGTGNSSMNFVLAIIDGLFGHLLIPVILGFVLHLGLMGLWYGYGIAGFTPFFVGIVYMVSGKWKTGRNWLER